MAIHSLPLPDEREGTLEPGELFFSTTDARGVIRQGNSVFARVSGFTPEELTGVPHNVVRHRDMPAGLFRLVWERLAAGRPAGAYVRNRTKSGGAYWVYALISPLRDGYVSVRMAPGDARFDLARRVYARAVEVEREAVRTLGERRHEAAGTGAAAIEALLEQHGFASYDEFMLATLPAELSAQSELLSAAHDVPAGQGPVAEALDAARALDGLLGDLIGRLAAYQRLCDQSARASGEVLDIVHRLDRAVREARDASRQVEDDAPVLANVARVMTVPMRDAVTGLERLQADLGRLRADVAELRFRISMAGLYNHMAAAFAAEVIAEAAPPDTLSAVPLLCSAAHTGVLEMSAQVRRVNDGLRGVADLVREVSEPLEDFRRFLAQWRNLVLRYRVSEVVRDRLHGIDAEISASWDWMQTLHTLGREHESAVVPFDLGRLEAELVRIGGADAAG